MNGLALYLAYRFFTGLFGLLPEPVMRRTGEVLGAAAYYIAPRKRALVSQHMRRIGAEPALVATRRAFASYGRYWAEVFWMRPRRVEAMLRRISTDGLEHVWAARDAGRGVILALPHLGSWEAAGLEAARQGVPVTAVAEALANRRISSWFTSVRAYYGIEVVLARPGVSSVLEDRLRAGKTVALLCDRDLKGTGVPVEFFGEETTLPPGPVRLAMRTGAALLPVATYFAPGPGHHNVVLAPLDIPAGGTDEQRLAQGTRLLAAALEDLIRRRPVQWHLMQPNWPSDRETTHP